MGRTSRVTELTSNVFSDFAVTRFYVDIVVVEGLGDLDTNVHVFIWNCNRLKSG